MRSFDSNVIDISAISAVFISLISIPYLDWWGFLVGPAMVVMFAWAYYSMVFVIWIGGVIKRFIARA